MSDGNPTAEPKLKTSAKVTIAFAAIIGLALVLLSKNLELWAHYLEEHQAAAAAAGGSIPRYPLNPAWWVGVFAALAEHIGAGAIVAGGVAIFFHVEEFKEFFTSLATGVLVDHHFLRRLNLDALSKLRAGIAAVTVKRFVANPAYNYEAVTQAADDLLYGTLLPTRAAAISGLYRINYREFTTIRKMAVREMFARLETSIEGMDGDELDREVLEETVVTSYRVVSPALDPEGRFEIPMSAEVSVLPVKGVTQREQMRLWVRTTGVEHLVEMDVSEKSGTRFYQCTRDERRFVSLKDGGADVWLKSVDYKVPGLEPFLLNTMSVPTWGAHVSLIVEPALGSAPLHYRVFGLGGEQPTVQVRECQRLELVQHSWFLKDHGWCIWW